MEPKINEQKMPNLKTFLNARFRLEGSETEKIKLEIEKWCRKVKCERYRVDAGKESIVVYGMAYNGSDVPILVYSIRYPVFRNIMGHDQILYDLVEETEYKRQ
jgi:hypothetical protein